MNLASHRFIASISIIFISFTIFKTQIMKTFNVLIIALLLFATSCQNDDDAITPVVEDVVPEFLANLSELNLFTGDLSDLNISSKAFQYNLNSILFTDYAHKQRLIALPNGTSMEYVDDGFPNFPENTVIAKTFFYNIDDRDISLGKTIIETRVLIKKNGAWELGNYKWNEAQTDAVLDTEGADLSVSWIDNEGETNNVTYQIPNSESCFTCHNNAGNETPIGPKLRTMNFNVNGSNQLQDFIDNQYLSGITSSDEIGSLPNYEDTSLSLEERTRAYMDVNCSHCHSPGGFCELQSPLDLRYETSFDDSNIFNQRFSIQARISSYIPEFSMPFIGTTMLHEEGVDLIQDFLDTL
jgi:uncharacterized repeat protein (TIGR03806 family)